MRHFHCSFSIAYLLPVLSIVSLKHAFPQVASDDEAAATTSTLTRPGRTSTVTALTLFTPSSGADPIPITSQSQLVTSYVPVLTICPYAPSAPALTTIAPNTSRPTNTSVLLYSAATAPTAPAASHISGLYRRQAAASPAPYANATVSTSYLSSCSVSYTATTTQICHATLSPLASPVIPVTDCEQQITFSTDHGYTVVPGNRTADVQGLTSYYAARWDDIATGVPQGGIQKEVCSTAGCRTEWEAWSTGVVLTIPNSPVTPFANHHVQKKRAGSPSYRPLRSGLLSASLV